MWREARETGGEMGKILIWGFFGLCLSLVVLTVLATWAGAINIPLLNIQRRAIQQSPGYVQSKQNALIDLKAQYLRLDVDAQKYEGQDATVEGIRAQQKAVLDQMYRERSMISADVVPDDVTVFLMAHPQGGG